MKKDYRNIFMRFVPILLTVCLFAGSRVSAISSSIGLNLTYIKLINFTLPIVKNVTFDENDLAEGRSSIKDMVLNTLGLNYYEPFSIVEREASILNRNTVMEVSVIPDNIAFDPFKLNSDCIQSDITNENEVEKTDINAAILDASLKKLKPSAKPEVLIYHTHTTEAYAGSETAKTADSSQADMSVVGAGNVLAKMLKENYGISVIHDTTFHNLDANTNSYTRSRQTLAKYLKEYGDFKIIIDLHRDATYNRKEITMNINNSSAAKYMFVLCKGNPHFNKNYQLTKQLIDISERRYPGLLRNTKDGKGIYFFNTGTKFFHQDLSNNAILIEIGSQINTPSESQNTAQCIATVIAEYLKNTNQ